MTAPDLWQDPRHAAKLTAEHARLAQTLTALDQVSRTLDDLAELACLSAGDPALERELARHLRQLADDLDGLDKQTAPTGRYAGHDTVIVITAGAGGTEAHWWTEQLYGMYTVWATRNGWKVTAETDPAPEAGLRAAALTVRGPGVYGRARCEAGVHRLSRVSDFDPSGRRHTSFARVETLPVLADTDLRIDERDLRVDTYRASGPGGQHRNKTDSAVRITHLPSGLQASCAQGRSQHDNRRDALQVLRGRLAEQALRDRQAELDAERGELAAASFGQRIRSYVLHPYTMVTDHRTAVKRRDVAAVLAGDIDSLIDAELARHAR